MIDLKYDKTRPTTVGTTASGAPLTISSYGNFLSGSHLYGCPDEDSDIDVIVVLSEVGGARLSVPFTPNPGEDPEFIMYNEFKRALYNHEPKYLEAFLLGKYRVDSTFDFEKIDLGKLRESFSATASNSWVKAKKKIDKGDFRTGLKSAWHAIRILDFGIQIANNKTIVEKGRYNWLRKEILELEKAVLPGNLWDIVAQKYLKTYKDLKRDFRKVAPKTETEHHQLKTEVINTLKKHDVAPSSDLVKDLLKTFEL